jgi:hypothetical protein
VKSTQTSDFRALYAQLPLEVQRQAVAAFRRFRDDPFHQSLRFKRLAGTSNRWSVRIWQHYRAVARREGDILICYWIGTHADYDDLIDRN